ncbi:unnamed protein product [Penicillium bialowiezense]
MVPLTVRTASGLVQGAPSDLADGVTVFKGMPYAASTAGENRWRPPQPPEPWNGLYKATVFGPMCPQTRDGSVHGSEDCLNLNIWTPSESLDENLPVYVWIHGGRFTFGSGCDRLHDGSGLAQKGIIVVTFNYRCGILDLSEESNHHSSGNFGFLDQVAALKWVQENIGAFGGDRTRVTIGGQSAGAASVGLHMMSPLSRGLFKACISQSGQRIPRDPLIVCLSPAYRVKEAAESHGIAVLKEKGVTTVAALRKQPLDLVLLGSDRADTCWGNPPLYRPCLDGWVIPFTYEESLKRGLPSDVPILTGHNADEGGTYDDPDFSLDDFQSCALQKYGPFTDRFLSLYSPSGSINARDAWNEACRDCSRVTIACWAKEYHRHSKSSVFGYHYAHEIFPRHGPSELSTPQQVTGAKASAPKPRVHDLNSLRSTYTYSKPRRGLPRGAFHGSELPFVFNSADSVDGFAFGEVDEQVTDIMMTYWSNFIKKGTPNGGSVAEFPDIRRGEIMYLTAWPFPMTFTKTLEKMVFWEEYLQSQKSW